MTIGVLITLGVLFLGWIVANAKTSRPDGDLVKGMHPYRRIMWHIMPSRNESVVFYDEPVRAEKLLAYIDAAKESFPVDLTHCVVAACAYGLAAAPKMNHFISGRRMYRRKGRFISFSMKRKKLNKEAKLAVVKLEMLPQETFRDLCGRINQHINVERSDTVTYADKEFNLFYFIPRPVLAMFVRIFRWLDYHNLLPGAFIARDPLYVDIVVANLGSVKMSPGFHHLYEWGNAPLFLMVGQVEQRAVVVDGKIEVHTILPLRWSYDERIEDGFNADDGMKAVQRALEDPWTYLGCLDANGADARPLDAVADIKKVVTAA